MCIRVVMNVFGYGFVDSGIGSVFVLIKEDWNF